MNMSARRQLLEAGDAEIHELLYGTSVSCSQRLDGLGSLRAFRSNGEKSHRVEPRSSNIPSISALASTIALKRTAEAAFW